LVPDFPIDVQTKWSGFEKIFYSNIFAGLKEYSIEDRFNDW